MAYFRLPLFGKLWSGSDARLQLPIADTAIFDPSNGQLLLWLFSSSVSGEVLKKSKEKSTAEIFGNVIAEKTKSKNRKRYVIRTENDPPKMLTAEESEAFFHSLILLQKISKFQGRNDIEAVASMAKEQNKIIKEICPRLARKAEDEQQVLEAGSSPPVVVQIISESVNGLRFVSKFVRRRQRGCCEGSFITVASRMEDFYMGYDWKFTKHHEQQPEEQSMDPQMTNDKYVVNDGIVTQVIEEECARLTHGIVEFMKNVHGLLCDTLECEFLPVPVSGPTTAQRSVPVGGKWAKLVLLSIPTATWREIFMVEQSNSRDERKPGNIMMPVDSSSAVLNGTGANSYCYDGHAVPLESTPLQVSPYQVESIKNGEEDFNDPAAVLFQNVAGIDDADTTPKSVVKKSHMNMNDTSAATNHNHDHDEESTIAASSNIGDNSCTNMSIMTNDGPSSTGTTPNSSRRKLLPLPMFRSNVAHLSSTTPLPPTHNSAVNDDHHRDPDIDGNVVSSPSSSTTTTKTGSSRLLQRVISEASGKDNLNGSIVALSPHVEEDNDDDEASSSKNQKKKSNKKKSKVIGSNKKGSSRIVSDEWHGWLTSFGASSPLRSSTVTQMMHHTTSPSPTRSASSHGHSRHGHRLSRPSSASPTQHDHLLASSSSSSFTQPTTSSISASSVSKFRAQWRPGSMQRNPSPAVSKAGPGANGYNNNQSDNMDPLGNGTTDIGVKQLVKMVIEERGNAVQTSVKADELTKEIEVLNQTLIEYKKDQEDQMKTIGVLIRRLEAAEIGVETYRQLADEGDALRARLQAEWEDSRATMLSKINNQETEIDKLNYSLMLQAKNSKEERKDLVIDAAHMAIELIIEKAISQICQKELACAEKDAREHIILRIKAEKELEEERRILSEVSKLLTMTEFDKLQELRELMECVAEFQDNFTDVRELESRVKAGWSS